MVYSGLITSVFLIGGPGLVSLVILCARLGFICVVLAQRFQIFVCIGPHRLHIIQIF